MLNQIFARWSTIILLVAAFTLPVTLWVTVNLLKTNSNKVEDWLPQSLPETQLVSWFHEHFKGDEVLIVSWRGCTIDDKRLDTLEKYATRSIDQDGQLLFRRVVTGRGLFKLLSDPANRLSEATVKRRLSGWLLGPDEKTTCAILMVDSSRFPDRHRAVAEVERIAAEYCQLDKSELIIGGPTADSVFIDRVSAQSLYFLSSSLIVAGVLLAWIFLKEAVLVCATFATALLAELYSLTIIYVSGTNMDAVLTMVPLLVYVLTICACVHFLNSYCMVRSDCDDAPIKALQIAWKPTTLAALTSAVGLASLTVSDLLPIRKFGIFGATGVLVSIPVILVFLTAFLTRFPARPKRANQDPIQSSSPGMRMRLSRYAMANHRLILVGVAFLFLVFGYGGLQIRTSAKIRDMFIEGSKELEDYRWLEENVGSLVPIDVVLCFGVNDENNMLERAVLSDRVRAHVENVPLVSGVTSPSSFLPSFKNRSGLRGAFKRSHANSILRKKRTQLIESGLLAESTDEELWLVSGRVPVFSPVDYDQLLTEIDTRVETFLESRVPKKATDVRAVVSGGVPVINSVQKRLLIDLKTCLCLSILSIGVVLAIGLRSVGIACLILVPNVLPIFLIFGSMGWLGIAVDLGSMLTISTAIGVSVDNELHFVSWYRRQLATGVRRDEAIIKTLEHCGRAIFNSGMICGLGMLVLTFSPFLPTVRFGSIMAVLIVTAIVGDLVVLPAMLKSRLGNVFNPKTNQ